MRYSTCEPASSQAEVAWGGLMHAGVGRGPAVGQLFGRLPPPAPDGEARGSESCTSRTRSARSPASYNLQSITETFAAMSSPAARLLSPVTPSGRVPSPTPRPSISPRSSSTCVKVRADLGAQRPAAIRPPASTRCPPASGRLSAGARHLHLTTTLLCHAAHLPPAGAAHLFLDAAGGGGRGTAGSGRRQPAVRHRADLATGAAAGGG